MQKIRIYVDNSHIDTLYVSHRYINERVRQFKHNRIIHTHATHNTHTHTHTRNSVETYIYYFAKYIDEGDKKKLTVFFSR